MTHDYVLHHSPVSTVLCFAVRSSVAQEHPSRDDPERLATLEPESEDNVFFHAWYAPRVYSVKEALDMHREAMQPSMFNAPNADVILRLVFYRTHKPAIPRPRPLTWIAMIPLSWVGPS